MTHLIPISIIHVFRLHNLTQDNDWDSVFRSSDLLPLVKQILRIGNNVNK